jgi:hypothetical protein
MRLFLTVLGTAWVLAVAAAFVALPTWVGLDTETGTSGFAYWCFAWMLALVVGVCPFVIYYLLGDRE